MRHLSFSHGIGLQYIDNLRAAWLTIDSAAITRLFDEMSNCWNTRRQVFICGNGGSAANALHITNDLACGVGNKAGGLRATALSGNASVLTCLANDQGYDRVFADQLVTHAEAGDVLLVLSGSGNSPNILSALRMARELKMTSFAVVGFDGGTAATLADTTLHCAIDDMQIAEDIQLLLGHLLMKHLNFAGRGSSA